MAEKNKSIASKIIKKLATYLFIILLLFLLVSILLMNQKFRSDSSDRILTIKKFYIQSLKKPLWNFDHQQIASSVNEIAKLPEIIKAVVKDDIGNIIYESGTLENLDNVSHSIISKFNNSVMFDSEDISYYYSDIYFKYKDKDMSIGSLEIYSTNYKIHEFLIKYFFIFASVGSILLLLISLLTRKTINDHMRPVSFLTEKLNDFNHGDDIKEFYSIESDVKEIESLKLALIKMRDAVDSYNDNLEAQVVRRTKQLNDYKNKLEQMVEDQTKDLVIAKDAAVEANNIKTEFLANMSHELRTPMHAIISYSKMGSEKIEVAESQNNSDLIIEKQKLGKYFDNINKSGKRLLGLLNNLLDLSKIEAGKIILDTSESDMQEILESSLFELSPLLEAGKITIVQNISSEDMSCKIDRSRILQVFNNTISNAIKFSEENSDIIITIKDTKYSQNEGERKIDALQVSIEDEGVGIPSAELETIFDKFVQSSKTKSGSGGTGLGLAICKEIISAHKGNIWVENRAESGANITFILPRVVKNNKN